jgi:hypothetical protein
VVRNTIHLECICGLYDIAIRACSFARKRADSGRTSGSERFEKIAGDPGRVSWFEALSENFRVPGGGPLHGPDRICRDYPMALQGVSLSIEQIESRVKPL